MKIAERLTQLVGIPSVSGNEEAICSTIEAVCREARPSWPRQRLGNNLVVGPVRGGRVPAGAKRPLVGLVGHLDTVPPQGNETPLLRDGNLYGVGSADMKSGVAVMCDLLEHIPEASLHTDLLFVFYEKEEVGFDENGLGRLLLAIPSLSTMDFAFVLEPTALDLEVGCNGHINVEVVFRGKSAHSARVWLGENAIHKAGAFISRVAEIEPLPVTVGEATYRQVVSLTTAHAGIARNVVPDAFTFNLNHRFPPGRSPEEAVAYLRTLVPMEAEFRVIDVAPAGLVPRANAIYESFRRRFSLSIKGKQGWTDVARLTANGIDAVNFGPGHPELAHRVDEHVPIAELEGCRDILQQFLLSPVT
jgi:succinyl-diaminopimelate desuccinylase